MSFNLRKKPRLSYYEPEEPSFDEYIYCDRCADFVFDYCAIHGPLLVVPDDKVPLNIDVPSPVPRAALTIPHVFLHLAPSFIPGAGLGVFTTLTLPRGVRFGPYRGKRTQNVDSTYCWQIYDAKNRRSHVLDAADSERSNWMRYVNCARHWKEQNLVAYQFRGQLYYRTIKIIPRLTELMVFYGSEFANALHIDLSKYNSDKYYAEIICTPTKLQCQNEDVLVKDYLTADQFHFIDENLDKDNSQEILTNTDKNDKFLGAQVDDKSLKEVKCIENKDIILKTRYKCESCEKTFASSTNLKEHMKRQHGSTWKYNCEFCLYKSNRNYSFRQHVGKHTNTFKYFCAKCPFKTNYGRNFRRHCFRHENAKAVSANPSYNSVRNHLTEPKTCALCDFKTFSRKAFATHMSKHKGDIYKCSNCSYASHSKYNLSRHNNRLAH